MIRIKSWGFLVLFCLRGKWKMMSLYSHLNNHKILCHFSHFFLHCFSHFYFHWHVDLLPSNELDKMGRLIYLRKGELTC